VNPAELQGRMREAENAILSRLQTLTQDSESCVERQAIGEAVSPFAHLKNKRAVSRQLGALAQSYNAVFIRVAIVEQFSLAELELSRTTNRGASGLG
jgi:hypothetical protein